MNRKILIVDDEEALVDILVEIFARAGWESTGASDGKKALVLIDSFKPNVVISDINMPNLDGLAMLETIQKKCLDTPVILLSGHRDTEKMKRAWAASVFDYIDKPFNEEALLQLANNAFEYGEEYVRSARKRYLRIKRAA